MNNRDSEQSERQLSQQSNYFQVRPELAGSLRSGRIRRDVYQQELVTASQLEDQLSAGLVTKSD